MCGVIGYIGLEATPELFYQGLKRLEYRGYDSAGIAMLTHESVFIQRAEGKLANLEKKLHLLPKKAHAGIGHTRWATHGRPSEKNAHPHRSQNIVLLHNGIIENYTDLKLHLQSCGYHFESETDTEVAAHLLHYEFNVRQTEPDAVLRMKNALLALVHQIRGTFAFGILCLDIPDILFVVKYGSPIVIGLGQNANFMASGIAALVEHTRSLIILDDNEIAFLRRDQVDIFDFQGQPVQKEPMNVTWSQEMLEKNGFDHFMLKEIYEEPQAVAQTLSGRINRTQSCIDLQSLGVERIAFAGLTSIHVIACGTSYYAALLARYFIEQWTRLPVTVELASEYRYRCNLATEKTLCVAVSQSGETIDTLQAIKWAKEHRAQTIALVNMPGSTIGYVCQAESLMHAGPEVGVASTKAFSAQVVSLLLLGLAAAQEGGLLGATALAEQFDELAKISHYLEETLQLSEHIEKAAKQMVQQTSVLFVGRGPQWAVALEGALKLKEISYIHAEAFAAGELKHGPIALIDEGLWVVCLAPRDSYYEKTCSNIEEIKARGGRIFAIGTQGDHHLDKLSDLFIGIPTCGSVAQPFLTALIVHLLAYWTAVHRGCDVDQPRNLAKSVTVE